MRTCVGCRRTAPQTVLVRVIRSGDGTLVAGRTLPGRGAWFCAGSPVCIDLATRRGALQRALRGPVTEGSVASLRAEQAGRARMEDHTERSVALRQAAASVENDEVEGQGQLLGSEDQGLRARTRARPHEQGDARPL